MPYPGTTIQLWGRDVKIQTVSSSPPTSNPIMAAAATVVSMTATSSEHTLTSRSPVDGSSPCTSEEEEDLAASSSHDASLAPDCTGKLFKWTNYFHGWQDRFIVLRNGCLSYYKTPNDQTLGCRGALNIRQAVVQAHEFDNCRFDVIVNENIWYLRAETTEERNRWITALQEHKLVLESGYGSDSSLRRHGSILSLTSAASLSIASSSSHKTGRALQEKLAEMETFKDILTRQVDTLQSYFDTCAGTLSAHKAETHRQDGGGDFDSDDELDETLRDSLQQYSAGKMFGGAENGSSHIPLEVQLQHAHHGPDFKGEAITFRATTGGLLETLRHCVDLMSQREEGLKRKLEKEVERRKRTELMYRETAEVVRGLQDQLRKQRVFTGPDHEEGPQSTMKEEEFFDAVETALDRQEKELDEAKLDCLSSGAVVSAKPHLSVLSPAQADDIWEEIEQITNEQFKYALLGVGEGGWQLFNEDGEMKMYRREEEKDGLVVDPLKAQHCVRGFTAHEMCNYFFSPDVRMEWEFTVDHMKVIEKLRDDTMVFHQVHKRIWPAAQRDALFWSHIRKGDESANKENNASAGSCDEKLVPVNSWIVCNHSVEVPPVPLGKCLRVILTISLTCQTFVDAAVANLPADQISRDQVTTKITYCATVNPGGWAPASVLRAVYKREYPKFLKRFTQYVKEQTETKPILW
ncbi:Collagen type IV alpha-3-binding protein [Hypsibius exemplaris]|uniref:Ceramide transfer protein n=1 Tax=Hypsibius exemplaris TaxID=2072580 RepID=A0A1W0WPT9_HYPEX|nr:Collagen type IV alpha-3-binding protein [Hypsibius exemplaris]